MHLLKNFDISAGGSVIVHQVNRSLNLDIASRKKTDYKLLNHPTPAHTLSKMGEKGIHIHYIVFYLEFEPTSHIN